MKKSVITILKYFFFLGLGVLFVWLSVRKIDYEQWLQIRASIQKARLWLIIPVSVMLLLSHYSRALRWRILMEPMGYNPSRFNTFAAVMIGYLVNAGVPRLGEVVKCTMLARYEKVRADRLIGTIVMERAVDVICLLIAFVAAVFFQGHVINGFVRSLLERFFRDAAGNTSIVKIILYVSILLAGLFVLYLIGKRFAHIDAIKKIKDIVKGVFHGLLSIRSIKHKGWFLFHTVLIWMLYFGSTTVGLYALRETAHLGAGGGLTTLAVGSVGMVLTPGGIGAYPLLVAKLMGLYGLDETTTGNALGWLLWTIQTVIIVFGGLIFTVLFSFFNKNKRPGEDNTELTDEDLTAPRAFEKGR